MSVVILDHCPSCGVCSRKGVCPTDAIKVENGKTFIAKGCIDCGLCIPVCPIGVIVERSVEEAPAPAPKQTNRKRNSQQITADATEMDAPKREEADDEQTSTGV